MPRNRQANHHLRHITAFIFGIAMLLERRFEFGFKVAAGGIIQNQIHLEVQQIRHRPIHFLLERAKQRFATIVKIASLIGVLNCRWVTRFSSSSRK